MEYEVHHLLPRFTPITIKIESHKEYVSLINALNVARATKIERTEAMWFEKLTIENMVSLLIKAKLEAEKGVE